MRVLLAPDFSSSNPYQRSLADALRKRAVEVRMARTRHFRPLPLLGPSLRPRPAVLHLHWTHPYLGGGRDAIGRWAPRRFLAELRLARRLGVRIVWTVHNLAQHDGVHRGRELRLHHDLLELADAAIVHCEAARDAVIDALQPSPVAAERIHVIPHGHYIDAYPNTVGPEESRRQLGLPAAARVFLFAGQIRGYKGVEELIVAFRELPDPDARLVIAGRTRGPAVETRITAIAAPDARILTSFTFVPVARLQLYYNAADAVVLPFRDILTSGSLILAMSFGRPVVAPRLGCLAETVDPDAGILYEPRDLGALRAALEAALGSDLEAMGRRSLESARRLDWGRIADATLRAYRAAGAGMS